MLNLSICQECTSKSKSTRYLMTKIVMAKNSNICNCDWRCGWVVMLILLFKCFCKSPRNAYRNVAFHLYSIDSLKTAIQVSQVPQQIDIRWGCKFEAIDLLSEKLPLFVSTMMNVAENSLKCHDSKQSCQPSTLLFEVFQTRFLDFFSQNVCLVS